MSAKAKISGSVVAGFPSPAEQYLEPPLDLNELLVKRPAATYFVRVEGDSMIGAGIHDGDLLVVDRSLRPASGDVIIASVDGDFTVKTLRLREEGRGNREQGTGNREEIRLEPANPKYPTIVLKPGQELDYFGKVTACIHRY
jgi:DNA polymerase V